MSDLGVTVRNPLDDADPYIQIRIALHKPIDGKEDESLGDHTSLISLGAALVLSGCENMSERQKGTATGAGIGAAAGAVISSATGGKAGTDTGSAAIKRQMRTVLDPFAASLKDDPKAQLTLVGHTDSTGLLREPAA